MVFADRQDAGKVLAQKLTKYVNQSNLLVLGLPRGGVVVAFEVAKHLKAPLDVLVVRKLGVPGQSELAMGAIGPGGVRVLNSEIVSYLHIPAYVIDQVAAVEEKELNRREHMYRSGQPALDVSGKTVILVDDGLATGSTMRAALSALKTRSPAHIVIAVPVAAHATALKFAHAADEFVAVLLPEHFESVSMWYERFPQTEDGEVIALLSQSRLTETSKPV